MTREEFIANQMRAARREAIRTWNRLHGDYRGGDGEVDYAYMPAVEFDSMLNVLDFFCKALANKKNVRATIERNPDGKGILFKTYCNL